MELSPYKTSDEEEICELFTKVFFDSEGESEGTLIGNLVLNMMKSTEQKDIFGFVASEKEPDNWMHLFYEAFI